MSFYGGRQDLERALGVGATMTVLQQEIDSGFQHLWVIGAKSCPSRNALLSQREAKHFGSAHGVVTSREQAARVRWQEPRDLLPGTVSLRSLKPGQAIQRVLVGIEAFRLPTDGCEPALEGFRPFAGSLRPQGLRPQSGRSFRRDPLALLKELVDANSQS